MHYIIHLFRAFHASEDMFGAPFTPEQLEQLAGIGRHLRAGPREVPTGDQHLEVRCRASSAARVSSMRVGRGDERRGLHGAAREQLDRVGPQPGRAEHADARRGRG